MEFRCRECGFEFEASVPHLVDYAEDSSEPIRWTAERIGVTCPSCGSWRVELQDA
jgi:rubredoxin